MANPEHLAILKQGVKAWNDWRRDNLGVKIDLSGAALSGASLSRANLSWADLSKASLSRADLSGASLSRVNLTSAELDMATLCDASLGMATLTEANLSWANLKRANLSKAFLNKADLTGANLIETDLDKANLVAADLSRTLLIGANLSGADLTMASLVETNLSWADLSLAILREANLREANLTGARLNGATFNGARVGFTSFVGIDLSQVNGLDEVQHCGPSTIGIDTTYKSKGHIPENFLRGCGAPDDFIAFVCAQVTRTREFHSCVIIHSGVDRRFCERLHADLQAKGVRTWMFEEDSEQDETNWFEIDRSIRAYDKIVVALSEDALRSDRVLREIDHTLNREKREHANILLLLQSDPYIFGKWEHKLKADMLAKVVSDFSGWDSDAAKYEKAFDKLLEGLLAGK